MKKWKLYVILLLCFGMVGCANKQVGDSSGNTKPQTEGNINEKIEDHLYVEAEFHMPKKKLYTYSTELKKFDYDKVQSIFWPDANANEITTNKFGERCYKKATIGGESGSLIYRVNDDVDYLDTLCAYAKEKNIVSKKDLKFTTAQKARKEAEKLISKFEIGCELGEPYVIAVNSEDLNHIQKKMMKDDDYSEILNIKNLGKFDFDHGTELYYFEYPFVIQNLPVFGSNDPVIQYKGDDPLLAQNMSAKMIISNEGIEELQLEGVLNTLTKSSNQAEIIGYEGIREAIDKKFGDVILTEEYKVNNIWLEYFPLIQSDSFDQVEVVPVWCLDFIINGEDGNYTLRFHAITGEEIS